MGRNRFVNVAKREVDQLDLSDGDFVLVKKTLTNAERRHLKFAGLRMKAKAGEGETAEVEVDIEKLDRARLATYLNGWSFVNGDGKPVQFNEENIDLLDDGTYTEIVTALDSYLEGREKEKNSDSPPGRRTKKVGSGSTSTTSS